MEQEHHFFASSYLNWTCGRTLEEVKKRQAKADGASGFPVDWFNVYKVPGPVERPYGIRNYRPDVEGVEYVESVQYE